MMEKVAVFGCGVSGKWIVDNLGENNICCIIDNNINEKKYKNIDIMSIDEYIARQYKNTILISSAKYRNEMEEALKNKGINNFVFYTDYWFDANNSYINSEGVSRIFLINTHSFSNIGDHAITMAEYSFFRLYFPNYKIIDIPSIICRDGIDCLKEYISEEDVIFISGGGYLGSLWLDCGEANVREIIDIYNKNKIIIFPSTIYFSNDELGKIEKSISKQIYGKHTKLYFCVRDKNSYALLEDMGIKKTNIFYVPDMVLLLEKNAKDAEKNNERKGVALCLRKDKEGVISCDERAEIISNLKCRFTEIKAFDMHTYDYPGGEERFRAVEATIELIRTSTIVITDRLHCMLLCAISGTPCIAIDNISNKVSGVYSWISKLPYVFLTDKARVFDVLDSIELKEIGYSYSNSVLLKQYEKIAEIIE